MNKALLQQALDALDALTDRIDGTGFSSCDEFGNALDVIDALRTELANPEPDLAHDLHPDNDPLGMRAAYTHAAIADARDRQHRYANEYYTQCKGTNCTATVANQKHSDECIKEYEAACSGIAKPEPEPFCYAVVCPPNKYTKYPEVVFSAAWPEACHEHINDAINEHDIESAGTWVVRPLYQKEQL